MRDCLSWKTEGIFDYRHTDRGDIFFRNMSNLPIQTPHTFALFYLKKGTIDILRLI